MDLESQQKKAALANDYDASATGYEIHWAPALQSLARNFASQLELGSADAIVDIGAGTGSLLRYLAENTSASVVGVDRSLAMLKKAPGEAHRAVMDAEALALRDDSFDAAMAMFMIFHLPDPHAALREVSRVVKAGGTFAFTSWGDDDPDFGAFDVFDEILDNYGAAEGRGLYTRYEFTDTPDACRTLLEETGFDVVSIRAERMAHVWTVDHLIGFRTEVGYGRVRWESLNDEARERVLEEAREALSRLSPDEMTLRDEVIYSVGRPRR